MPLWKPVFNRLVGDLEVGRQSFLWGRLVELLALESEGVDEFEFRERRPVGANVSDQTVQEERFPEQLGNVVLERWQRCETCFGVEIGQPKACVLESAISLDACLQVVRKRCSAVQRLVCRWNDEFDASIWTLGLEVSWNLERIAGLEQWGMAPKCWIGSIRGIRSVGRAEMGDRLGDGVGMVGDGDCPDWQFVAAAEAKDNTGLLGERQGD